MKVKQNLILLLLCLITYFASAQLDQKAHVIINVDPLNSSNSYMTINGASSSYPAFDYSYFDSTTVHYDQGIAYLLMDGARPDEMYITEARFDQIDEAILKLELTDSLKTTFFGYEFKNNKVMLYANSEVLAQLPFDPSLVYGIGNCNGEVTYFIDNTTVLQLQETMFTEVATRLICEKANDIDAFMRFYIGTYCSDYSSNKCMYLSHSANEKYYKVKGDVINLCMLEHYFITTNASFMDNSKCDVKIFNGLTNEQVSSQAIDNKYLRSNLQVDIKDLEVDVPYKLQVEGANKNAIYYLNLIREG